MNIRVAELTGVHSFRITGGNLEDPAPGEVQVRIEYVGICGSDLHSYSEGAVGDTPSIFPMVLGHEPAGTILKLGAGATGWSSGDRAAFEPAIYCYHCEFCLAGRHNICRNLRFMSTTGEPGFFRECANIPAHNLVAIPEGVSAAQATIIEPLAVVLHSMQLVKPVMGETAAVFGAGPIGLMTAIALRLAGAGRVWVVEPVAERRDMTARLATQRVIDPAAVDPVKEILRETGGRGVDIVLDCAAKQNTINQSMLAASNGGRVAITGIPDGVTFPIEFSPMRRKELTLFNVRRSNHETSAAAALLSEHLGRFAPMITHERPLEGIGEAFDIAENYRDGAGKILIKPAGA
jgi:L-iditol 2-dehydrogenase